MRTLFWLSLLAVSLMASPRQFTSGETRTPLLELYSSEGCSSCPPSEAWLGGLSEAPGLWRDFVPVAFKVTYWDRLGWPDQFAQKKFTDRQHAYATLWRSDRVYTPAFVLNGQEWRGRELPPAGGGEAVGRLTLSYDQAGSVGRIHFAAEGPWEAHVVWLGGGIVSAVKAGENRGRTLQHEFVALKMQTVTLHEGRAVLALPKPTVAGVTRLALAVWVTRPGALTPQQATGGWVE